jgi:hypothetical protein
MEGAPEIQHLGFDPVICASLELTTISPLHLVANFETMRRWSRNLLIGLSIVCAGDGIS